MNGKDLAYIAGFFDGEGSIGIYKVRGYHRLSVQISNTDLGVLDWMRDVIGAGNIQTTHQNLKPSFKLQLANISARKFLKLIIPYLKVKRNQAEIAIALNPKSSSRCNGFQLTESEITQRDQLALRVNGMNSLKGNRKVKVS